VTGVYIQCVH